MLEVSPCSNPDELTVTSTRRLLKRHPNKIPIVLHRNSDRAPKLSTYKLLIPDEWKVQELLYFVRTKIYLSSNDAIFLFMSSGKCLVGTDLLSKVYNEQAEPVLHVRYDVENAFG